MIIIGRLVLANMMFVLLCLNILLLCLKRLTLSVVPPLIKTLQFKLFLIRLVCQWVVRS